MQSFFISSTFRDMQGERDALHRMVMPRVRDLAKEYGQSVQFVDLRWGISTADMEQQDAQNKILQVCLREIDACAPFMIVLLGERYGWMPGRGAIGSAAGTSGFTPENTDMSITELEIQYGIWKNQGVLDRCIFCFRDPVEGDCLSVEEREIYEPFDSEDRVRMDKLKRKIEENPTAQIFRYSLTVENGQLIGYDGFAEELSKRLCDLLRGLWGQPRKLAWQEKQQMEDRLQAENLQANFVGMNAARKKYAEGIRKNQLVVIEGGGGSGKSAMMAQLSKDLAGTGRTEVIFCGATQYCMRMEQLLRILVYRLEDQPIWLSAIFKGQEEAEDLKGSREQWNRACREYRGKPVIFFIDAIDQLMPEDALLESWFVPTELPAGVHLVVSTTGKVGINRMLLGRGTGGKTFSYAHFRHEVPNETEKREIALAHFAREHKQISEPVLQALLAHPRSSSMLCLDMMVRWLSALSESDFRKIAQLEKTQLPAQAIDSYLLEQIKSMPEREKAFIHAYIRRIMHFLSPHDEGDRLYASSLIPLYFICMTSHGLSRRQMEEIQESIRETLPGSEHVLCSFWNETQFSRMCAYMGPQLVERDDGRVDIAHRMVREALRWDSLVYNYAIVMQQYLMKRGEEDETRQEDLIPVCLMHLDFERENNKDPDSRKTIITTARYAIQDVIADAGNATESEEPEKAASGKLAWERLVRNVTADLLTDPGRDSKIAGICEVLEDAAAGGESHYYWLFSFFLDDIVKQLNKRGYREKVHACRILITAAHEKYREGSSKDFAGWSDQQKKKQLLWQQRVMNLMRRIHGELENKRYSLNLTDEAAGAWDKECKDFESRAEKWMPQDPWALYRLSQLECMRAMIASDERKAGPAERSAEKAADLLRRMTRAGEDQISRHQQSIFFAWGMSNVAEIYCDLAHDAIFRVRHFYKKAERIIDEVLAFVQSPGKGPASSDREDWFRLNTRRAIILSGLDRDQEAVDLLWDIYAAYEDPAEPLSERERTELSEVGMRAGLIMMYGYSPAVLYSAEKGETKFRGRSRAFDIILRREKDYLETALQGDTVHDWKMLNIKLFTWFRTSFSSLEEEQGVIHEMMEDLRHLRGRLNGSEDFDTLELDSRERFLKKLMKTTEEKWAKPRK